VIAVDSATVGIYEWEWRGCFFCFQFESQIILFAFSCCNGSRFLARRLVVPSLYERARATTFLLIPSYSVTPSLPPLSVLPRPSTTMSPVIHPKTVTLYVPSTDKTIEFTYSPKDTYSDILKSIRIVLGVDLAFAYNTKHRAVVDFSRIKDGSTLIIATDYFELPLSPAKEDVLIIRDGAEPAWKELSPEQKRNHVTALREISSPTKTYLTLSIADVQARLESVTTTSTPLWSSLETIQENWGLPLEAILGLQGLTMPYDEVENWDAKLMPALAVLSEATVGQGTMVSNLIIDTVSARKGKIVEATDVFDVGAELYKKAILR
jgi:hypothetical protein